MNPWGYLILDILGIIILISSVLSFEENSNSVVLIIGIFSATIPFGLSAFFMKPVYGGLINMLTTLAFYIGVFFCILVILGGIAALVITAFDRLNKWMERRNKKERYDVAKTKKEENYFR